MAQPRRILAALSYCLFISQSAFATDWIPVDDFNSYNEGHSIEHSPKWQPVIGFSPATIATAEDGNPVAQVEPGQAIATSITAGSLAIPEGQSGVIFMKFRALDDSRYWSGVFGMASKEVTSANDLNVAWTLGNPGQGGRPNATFAILGDKKDEILLKNRGRMNKAYANEPEIEPNVWYHLWVEIDNSRDEVHMYIQGGKFEKRAELTSYKDAEKKNFQFKTASASDLTHFVILNPTDPEEHNPRSIQVDEINFFVQAVPSALAGAN